MKSIDVLSPLVLRLTPGIVPGPYRPTPERRPSFILRVKYFKSSRYRTVTLSIRSRPLSVSPYRDLVSLKSFFTEKGTQGCILHTLKDY